jgi:hypothetical protein
MGVGQNAYDNLPVDLRLGSSWDFSYNFLLPSDVSLIWRRSVQGLARSAQESSQAGYD